MYKDILYFCIGGYLAGLFGGFCLKGDYLGAFWGGAKLLENC